MIRLDEAFMREVGLQEMPLAKQRKFLAYVYETLELRVGTQIANMIPETQLAEFERLIDGGESGESTALSWLDANCPQYKSIVHTQFEALKTEIVAMAADILDAS